MAFNARHLFETIFVENVVFRVNLLCVCVCGGAYRSVSPRIVIIFTVAILAQGTSWAVAVTQAFFGTGSILGGPAKLCPGVKVFNVFRVRPAIATRANLPDFRRQSGPDSWE